MFFSVHMNMNPHHVSNLFWFFFFSGLLLTSFLCACDFAVFTNFMLTVLITHS